MATPLPVLPDTPAPDPAGYGDAFPASTKAYRTGPRGLRVPVREIRLSGGEPPLQVYDSSGPQGHDVRQGLPEVRGAWIRAREVEPVGRSGGQAVGGSPASVVLSDRPAVRPSTLIPDSLLRTPLRGRGPVTQLHYARRPSSCGAKSRAAAPSSPPTSITPNSSR
jgi:phosphomethylpyrimidine synthase